MKDKKVVDLLNKRAYTKDEDGKECPSFCFASQICDELNCDFEEYTENNVASIALKNGFNVLKTFPNENVRGGVIILAQDCDKSSVDKMYLNFFGEVPDIEDLSIE